MSDLAQTHLRAQESSALQAPADLRPLANRSMFWRPVYLAPSAWTEHVPFAFWLVEAHRPRVFVELGTHYGTSYFGFCQAVDRLNLDTQCFAVDTWKGDEHAGEYDEQVYRQVEAHNEAHYSGFSRLVRSTFDEALGHFTDGTVDLLHIDGLHTLEAVSHDFESWLPKLSPRAIVVFHDINVRERGFGVFKLFEQLAQRYPVFEFVHGHGLGVVGVGPDAAANESVEQLFQANADPARQRAVREVFSRLGRACADAFSVREGQKAVDQVESLQGALNEVRRSLDARTSDLAAVRSRLEVLSEKYASERGQWVERLSGEQSRGAELVAENTRLRQELREAMQQLQPLLEASRQGHLKELEIARTQARIDALTAEMAEAKEQLAHRDLELRETRQQMETLQDTVRQGHDWQREAERAQARVDALTTDLAAANERSGACDQEIERLRDRLASVESSLSEANTQSAQRRTDFAALSEQLRQRERAFEELRVQSARRLEALSASAAAERERAGVRVRELEALLGQREELLGECRRSAAELQAALDQARGEVDRLGGALQQSRDHVAGLSQSRSWRLTAPLRWVARPFARGSSQPDVSQDPSEDVVALLEGSPYFDADWYLKHNPDVAASGTDPIRHYLEAGAGEGRDPSPLFSTSAYLDLYPDVGESAANPLIHFLRFGQQEGRRAVAADASAGSAATPKAHDEEQR